MRKVKAQPLRRVQRAGLLYVRPENVAQRSVDEMRAGVIADDARAAIGVGYDGQAVTLGVDRSGGGLVRKKH